MPTMGCNRWFRNERSGAPAPGRGGQGLSGGLRAAVAGGLALLAGLAAGSLAARPLEPEPTLWVADRGGVFELDRRNLAVRRELASSPDARTLAVAARPGVLWAVAGGRLRVSWLDGPSLAALQIEAPADRPVSLAVDAEEGSAFFASGDTVRGFSRWGEQIFEESFRAEVQALEPSPADGGLWVVLEGSLASVDRRSGRTERSLLVPGLRSATADPATADLWVAAAGELRRYDALGNVLLSVPAPGLEQLTAAEGGGVWARRGREVVLVGEAGEELWSLTPFPEPEKPLHLSRDDASGSLWVASQRRIHRYSRAGWLLEAADLGAAAQLRDLAPGAGRDADETPPELRFRGLAPGADGDSARPELILRWRDSGSGVDPSTLRLAVGGVLLSTDCRSEAAGATCRPSQDLPAGSLQLTAQVADFAGNLSAEAELSLRRGEERKRGEDLVASSGQAVADPMEPHSTAGYFTFEAPDRGQSVNNIYLTEGDLESISTSSGNVTLSIPLGQTYSVGPVLSYQLRVTHNSNVWQEVSIPCTWPLSQRPEHCNNSPQDGKFLISVPNINSNAGLGWEFHFGKLYGVNPPTGIDGLNVQRYPSPDADGADGITATWLYLAPDGASHRFHRLTDRPGDSTVHYTVDGSFLRLREVTGAEGELVRVEHPNSMTSVFERTGEFQGTEFCGAGVSGCWRLLRVEDLYGNRITADYALDGQTKLETWTIGDSTGRSHVVTFDTANNGGGNGTGDFKTLHPVTGGQDEWGDLRRRLVSVEVAAFGGQRQVHDFEYGPVAPVPRGRVPAAQGLGGVPTTLTTRVLQRIVPTGFPELAYTFQTDTASANLSGKIEEWTLPTHGRIQYDYARWYTPTPCKFKSPGYDPNPEDPPLWTHRFGIKEKRRRLGSGGNLARWTYLNELWPAEDDIDDGQQWVGAGPDCSRPDYRRTVVDGPERLTNAKLTRQVFYSSVTQRETTASESIANWQTTDHGLPFTKTLKVGTSAADYLFLSQQVLTCPTSAREVVPELEPAASGCTPDRSVYVRYGSEYHGSCLNVIGNSPACWQRNAVRVAERTVFEDARKPANEGTHPYRDTTFEEFNGLGAFGKTTTWGSSNWDSPPTTETTEYVRGPSGGLSLGATTGYFDMGSPSSYYPQPGQDWILHEYTSKEVSHEDSSFRTDYHFDGKGSLLCQRQRKEASADGDTDLVTVYQLGTDAGTDAGLPVLETRAGGDGAQLGSGPCATGSVRPEGSFHQLEHTYQDLQRSSSRVVSPFANDPGYFPFLFQVEIDGNTGLVATEFTVDGRRRDLTYDRLGRLTSVHPESSLGEASTALDHGFQGTAANPGNLNVTLRERAPDNSLLSERKTIFDDFGRPRQSEVRLPGGVTSRTETFFHSSGLPRYTTVLHDPALVADPPKTTNQDSDPQGKITKVTGPDGAEVRTTHFGEWKTEVERHVWVGDGQTAGGAAVRVKSRQLFDVLGRVTEDQGPEETWVTTYTRDALGRMTGAVREGQRRTFEYDGRGFLIRACYPEKGHREATSNQGCVLYESYNVLGQPRSVKDGPFERRYAFDRAGRLTRVSEIVAGQERPVKEYFYHRDNGTHQGSTDWTRGKLGRARRHNYVAMPRSVQEDLQTPEEVRDFVVTETYHYQGVSGRLSSRRTTVADPQGYLGGAQWFEQAFEYDALGRLTSEEYPLCENAECAAAALPRSLAYSYFEGYLTGVGDSGSPQGLAALSYHDNGSLDQVAHGNGAVDTVDLDPHRMARPRSFSTVFGGTTVFDSGPYQYDASGNIKEIGADAYAYNPASRLVWAKVAHGGTTTEQFFGFDTLDNLRSVKTGSVLTSLLVDTANNRLGEGYTYDDAGNLLAGGPLGAFVYDASGMVVRSSQGNRVRSYVLTPEDERLLIIEEDSTSTTPVTVSWTARNLGQKVLRRYRNQWTSFAGWDAWEWQQDYAYRGTSLLASFKPEGLQEHFHLDHLGTPRARTWLDAAGNVQWEEHKYLPFGEELTSPGPEALQFTGHERDRGPGLDRRQDLDYMHARYYTASLGRFLSVDPGRDGWNLYAYGAGNPIKYLDPDGRNVGFFASRAVKNPTVQRVARRAFDLISGVGDAVRSNIIGGAGRTEGGSGAFQVGQAAGDVVSMVSGALEAAAGGTIATGGTMATAGSVGLASPVSVPAVVGGTAVAVHGAVVASSGANNLGKTLSEMRAGRSGGGGRGKGANANDRKMVDNVAKEVGVDRRKFSDFIHEEKRGEGRRGADNLSRDRLLELAEEFKEMNE